MVVFLIFSSLAIKSLNKLGFKISSYYTFGRYFPGAGKWSIILYIIILAALVGIVLVFSKYQLKLSPA